MLRGLSRFLLVTDCLYEVHAICSWNIARLVCLILLATFASSTVPSCITIFHNSYTTHSTPIEPAPSGTHPRHHHGSARSALISIPLGGRWSG